MVGKSYRQYCSRAAGFLGEALNSTGLRLLGCLLCMHAGRIRRCLFFPLEAVSDWLVDESQ